MQQILGEGPVYFPSLDWFLTAQIFFLRRATSEDLQRYFSLGCQTCSKNSYQWTIFHLSNDGCHDHGSINVSVFLSGPRATEKFANLRFCHYVFLVAHASYRCWQSFSSHWENKSRTAICNNGSRPLGIWTHTSENMVIANNQANRTTEIMSLVASHCKDLSKWR